MGKFTLLREFVVFLTNEGVKAGGKVSLFFHSSKWLKEFYKCKSTAYLLIMQISKTSQLANIIVLTGSFFIACCLCGSHFPSFLIEVGFGIGHCGVIKLLFGALFRYAYKGFDDLFGLELLKLAFGNCLSAYLAVFVPKVFKSNTYGYGFYFYAFPQDGVAL